MKRKTKILVCIAVVLCIVLMAGIALAAPHMGYWHGDSRDRCQGFGVGTRTASLPHTQCAYPDCPSVTGKMGACINEGCRYYQECINEDCPRLTGGTCTNDYCPFTREQPQKGIDNGSTRNSGYGNGCHRSGHHSERHH